MARQHPATGESDPSHRTPSQQPCRRRSLTIQDGRLRMFVCRSLIARVRTDEAAHADAPDYCRTRGSGAPPFDPAEYGPDHRLPEVALHSAGDPRGSRGPGRRCRGAGNSRPGRRPGCPRWGSAAAGRARCAGTAAPGRTLRGPGSRFVRREGWTSSKRARAGAVQPSARPSRLDRTAGEPSPNKRARPKWRASTSSGAVSAKVTPVRSRQLSGRPWRSPTPIAGTSWPEHR